MRAGVTLGLLVVLAGSAGAGDGVPAPDFGRVDYARPQDALLPCAAFGSEGALRTIADGLEGERPVDTLRAIDRWIRTHFAYDANAAYAWRDFARMRDEGMYGGCADHAVLFGSLARAAGIPTVYVKTMDCDWIRAFRRGPAPATWSGHCFLEVFLDGRWALLDASAMTIVPDYDPRARILPGPRYAYDKGHDPYAMILSMRWDEWKEQTRSYFQSFDLAELPVPRGEALRHGTSAAPPPTPSAAAPQDVFLAADAPYWQWLTQRSRALGVRVGGVHSFNVQYEQYLERARGKLLLVTCVGERIVLPERYHETYLPVSARALPARLEAARFGREDRRLDDGTFVVQLYARDADAMREAVSDFTFEGVPAELAVSGEPPARPNERTVSIVGGREARLLADRLRQAGSPVHLVYNQNFEQWLPKGRGGLLFVLAPGGKPALPMEHLESLLGDEVATLRERFAAHAAGLFGRVAADGTRVFVIWAAPGAALGRQIATFDLALLQR